MSDYHIPPPPDDGDLFAPLDVGGALQRRHRYDLHTPAEVAITEAMSAVEHAGCDVRLTEAVILLERARARVADFVDGVDGVSIADVQRA